MSDIKDAFDALQVLSRTEAGPFDLDAWLEAKELDGDEFAEAMAWNLTDSIARIRRGDDPEAVMFATGGFGFLLGWTARERRMEGVSLE